jgi:hypothetical protein
VNTLVTPTRLALAVLLAILLGGCGPEVVTPTGPRPPTSPSAVTIYDKEPKKYEQLGMVEVPVGGIVQWNANGDGTPGYEKLLAAAAARGANGILLKPTAPDQMLVLAGYRGTYHPVPVRPGNPNAAVVQAIYMLER